MITFTPILSVIRLVPVWVWITIALLAWGGWNRHRATTATKAAAAAEQRAAVEAATSEAERKERQKEQQYAENARLAAEAYSANLSKVRASGDAARRELGVLLDMVSKPTAPASGAGSSPPASGGTDEATKLRTVLGECARAIQTVAEAADSDAARLKGLQDYVKSIKP